MNALISALMATPSVVRHAKEISLAVPDDSQVAVLKEKIFAPLNRNNGYSASEAIRSIQEVVVPVKYSMRRNQGAIGGGPVQSCGRPGKAA